MVGESKWSAPTTSIIGAGKLRIPSLTGANAERYELSKNLGLPSESTGPITCPIHRRLFQRDQIPTARPIGYIAP